MNLILASAYMVVILNASVALMSFSERVNMFKIYGVKHIAIFSFLAAILPVIRFAINQFK